MKKISKMATICAIVILGVATMFTSLTNGAASPRPQILDVAVVTGFPTARVQGQICYPAFLENSKIHVWIGTQNLHCTLEKGDRISISYPGEGDIYANSVVFPSCDGRIIQ